MRRRYCSRTMPNGTQGTYRFFYNIEIQSVKIFWAEWPGIWVVFLRLSLPLMMIAVIVAALKQLWVSIEFVQKAITVQGVIVGKWEEAASEGSLSYVGYQFSYMGEIWVGKQRAESYPHNIRKIGDSVLISFLPSNPNISRMEGTGK
jgi:hypothetical protein